MTSETCIQPISFFSELNIADKLNKICPVSLPKRFWSSGCGTYCWYPLLFKTELTFFISNSGGNSIRVTSRVKGNSQSLHVEATEVGECKNCYQQTMKLQHINSSVLAKVPPCFPPAPRVRVPRDECLSALPSTRSPSFQLAWASPAHRTAFPAGRTRLIPRGVDVFVGFTPLTAVCARASASRVTETRSCESVAWCWRRSQLNTSIPRKRKKKKKKLFGGEWPVDFPHRPGNSQRERPVSACRVLRIGPVHHLAGPAPFQSTQFSAANVTRQDA